MAAPIFSMIAKVCIPNYASIIELETLYIKLGCDIFQVIGRSDICPVG